MRISDYKNLIEALPVDQHSFEIFSENWKVTNQIELIEKIFDNNESVFINRFHLRYSTSEMASFIIKTLMWGYPTKGRGSNIDRLLESDNFEKLILKLEGYCRNKISLNHIIEDVSEIKGLGQSTITKFLYFLETTVEGYQALIFDEKIVRVLKSGRFDEFYQFKDLRTINLNHYVEYLSVIHQIANELKVDADKIELFLFLFGNNLSELIGEGYYDDDVD
jgi:hypothetical protein